MSFGVIRVLAVFMSASFCVGQLLPADDNWTQWGGEKRDFKVDAANLPSAIKLSEVWRRNLGEGYSAILVEDGKLYSMFRQGDDEFVICMDETTGKTIWEKSYSAPMRKGVDASFGKGPNSTPIIYGDAIVSIGFNGDLKCLEKQSGDIRWETNLIDDLGGTKVDLGYSQSPIVYEGNLILPIGGKGKGVAALSLKDGSVVWSAQDFKNSYSTPLLISLDGLDQMVFVMSDEVVSINPKNGNLFWSFPLKNQWSTHAFVPLWDSASKTLFVSSFRQSHGLRLSRDGENISFEKKWSIPATGVGFANAIIVNGIVIGSTGGSRSPLVTGIDLKTGNIVWRERGFGVGNFIAIGDRVIVLDEKGSLAIAKPTASAFNVIERQQVLNAPKAWTVPTLVANKLFLRDQKEIVKYELK